MKKDSQKKSNNDSNNNLNKDLNNLDVSDESLTPLAKRFLCVESAAKVRLATFILAGLCVVLFVLDFVVHRHAYAPNEGTPGFYALTGFLAFSFIVLGASGLRWFIARDEGYYAPKSVDAEEYPEEGLNREAFDDTESGK